MLLGWIDSHGNGALGSLRYNRAMGMSQPQVTVPLLGTHPNTDSACNSSCSSEPLPGNDVLILISYLINSGLFVYEAPALSCALDIDVGVILRSGG